jgi:NAD-dependent SIR2 family protein deacetylase
MKKSSVLFLGAFILLSAVGAFALASGLAVQQSAGESEAEVTAATCLACHGSFDDLAAATADFTTEGGETVTPHQYVPHEEKKEIPKCTECHQPHEIPLEDVSTVVKPDNVNWCYENCHHAYNLQPCSTCH